MNREQKRKQQKNLRKLGIDKRSFDVLVGLQAIKKSTQTIQSGDRVKLNVDAIRNVKDYDRLSNLYKKFVADHEDDEFTAIVDDGVGKYGNLFSLKEDPAGWLFWSGDLIKV